MHFSCWGDRFRCSGLRPRAGAQAASSAPVNGQNGCQETLDIETHDPELQKKGPGVRRDGYLIGVAVRTNDWAGEYYPIRHANGPNLEAGNVFSWLRDNLNGYAGEVVGANLLYDADYLQYEDIRASSGPRSFRERKKAPNQAMRKPEDAESSKQSSRGIQPGRLPASR
jgi:hypothetical protein